MIKYIKIIVDIVIKYVILVFKGVDRIIIKNISKTLIGVINMFYFIERYFQRKSVLNQIREINTRLREQCRK
jgi:hypothetical protein